jgi:hydroxymethylbilane synthase
MSKKLVRVGSRTSALALVQTQKVIDDLAKHYPQHSFEVVGIKTRGDRDQNLNISLAGGTGVFAKELEESLLSYDIDMAVHSMKDLPGKLANGLELGAIGWRDDVNDVLVSMRGYSVKSLPHQAKIGTSSVRRRAQLLRMRPDLNVVSIRGNIETRLSQLEAEQYDAIVLAAAGLQRLQLNQYPRVVLSVKQFLPAVGQGALAVEIRANDANTAALLKPVDDPAVRAAITAERTFMQELSGGCQAPMAALGVTHGGLLTLQGAVFNLEGSRYIDLTLSGRLEEAQYLGEQLAHELLAKGANSIFAAIKENLDQR